MTYGRRRYGFLIQLAGPDVRPDAVLSHVEKVFSVPPNQVCPSGMLEERAGIPVLGASSQNRVFLKLCLTLNLKFPRAFQQGGYPVLISALKLSNMRVKSAFMRGDLKA